MSRRTGGRPNKRTQPSQPAGAKKRRCHYCGAKTAAPVDQSDAAERSRYPHAPFPVEYPPVCWVAAEYRRLRAYEEKYGPAMVYLDEDGAA